MMMNKKELKKLSKSQLINLFLIQGQKLVPAPRKNNVKPIPAPRKNNKVKPVPAPRKTVKQMVKDYEENIILPPLQFRDDYKPRKPIASQRTKIEKTKQALKNYTESKIKKDPLIQLHNTRLAVGNHIKNVLKIMKGLKYVETLEVTFEKMSGNDIINKTAYFNSQTKIIINDSNIAESLESSEQELLNKVAVWISEGSGWTIESVNNHYLNVVKYEPIKGSSYTKQPSELINSKKGLVNIKNDDKECFRWCHIRYLNPQKKDPQRIKKVDKVFIENLNYSGIEFPVTTKQYNKTEKQNDININVFGYENKQPYPIYISKEKNEDCFNLLLITENENKHYVLIKDFNKFMYNQTKHKERKHFCMHCLQCFSSEKVLTNHKENCIQINGTQAIRMPTKKDNILKFNNFHYFSIILKPSQKKYMVVNLMMINHIQKHIRSI